MAFSGPPSGNLSLSALLDARQLKKKQHDARSLGEQLPGRPFVEEGEANSLPPDFKRTTSEMTAASGLTPLTSLGPRNKSKGRKGKFKIFDDEATTRGYDCVPLLDIVQLPRGGSVVSTEAVGSVQFGIPPETIKDSMRLGLDVPRVYIVPTERFCREMGPALGINLAEFEFPAYFNWFVRRKKCVLIVDTEEAERNIRQVFEETLLGPSNFRDSSTKMAYNDEDFDPDFPIDERPNFYREFEHFRISESNDTFVELTVDMLLDFRTFLGAKHDNSLIGVPPRLVIAEEEEEDEEDAIEAESLHNSFSDIRRPTTAARRRSSRNMKGSLDDTSTVADKMSLDQFFLKGNRRGSEDAVIEPSRRPKRESHTSMNSLGASIFSEASDDETKKARKWMYSKVKWLGEVATVWPMNATPEEIKKRSVPRVEIFRMPGASEYIIHDVNENNIIVGKARLGGTVRVPDELAVEGFLDPDSEMKLAAAASDEESVPRSVPPTFHPPSFGLTVLGNSHGFDKNGATSGYVLWINGRGIMIDPPPYSSATLEREGIRPQLILGVVITHCHADHDAGAFQKVLTGSRVSIITSPTIYESFIRKYSALSGLNATLLRHSHRFRPAIIGQPLKFQGATFHFFYTLHTIPCLAFRVEWRGRSMVFTGDHLNLPPLLDQLQDSGVLSKGRAHALKQLPLQECDALLHEAGAPPIHTPLHVLQSLPQRVRDRLYVVHTSALPPDSGLRVAPTGTAGTIRLDGKSGGDGESVVAETSLQDMSLAKWTSSGFPNISELKEGATTAPPVFFRPTCVSDAWFILNLLSNVPFFATLSYAHTMEVLEIASVGVFSEGDVVLPARRRQELLCVVWEGTLMEEGDEPARYQERKSVWHAGDWMGPVSLQPNSRARGPTVPDNEHEDVVAVSPAGVKVIFVHMKDLEKILKRGSKNYRMFLALEEKYQDETHSSSHIGPVHHVLEILKFNSVLGKLPAHQKRSLESIAEGPRVFEPGNVLWSLGERCDFAFLVVEGSATFGHAAVSRPSPNLNRSISGGNAGFGLIPIKRQNSRDRQKKRLSSGFIELGNGKLAEVDRLLQDVPPDSEYAKLESFLTLRAVRMDTRDDYLALNERDQRYQKSRDRYANKVLARLYASRKYTSGLIFSLGSFLCDTSRMVSGELVHEQSDALPQMYHSSTLVAGSDGCVAWVFARANLIPFLEANPGILLSLLGTQAVI